jgi:hypothetical protein
MNFLTLVNPNGKIAPNGGVLKFASVKPGNYGFLAPHNVLINTSQHVEDV